MNNKESVGFSHDAIAVKSRNKRLGVLAYVAMALAISVFAKPLLAAPEGTSEPTSKTSRAQSKKDADLLAKFKANNWSDYQPKHMEQITAAMASNTALREEVLQRFQGATDNVQRHHFSQLLRAASIPGFPAKALAWARDSKDVKTRVSAFSFLSTETQNPEIQALFINTLVQEQDVEVLGQVSRFFRRVDAPDPGTVDQVVSRLHDLTLHDSADLRAGSLQSLAKWDTKFRFYPDDLMRLLNDSESSVRVAAIGSTGLSVYSSEPLKARLVEILGDPKETLEVRSVVANNIARYEFKGAEYDKYKAALADFMKAIPTPVASNKN